MDGRMNRLSEDVDRHDFGSICRSMSRRGRAEETFSGRELDAGGKYA